MESHTSASCPLTETATELRLEVTASTFLASVVVTVTTGTTATLTTLTDYTTQRNVRQAIFIWSAIEFYLQVRRGAAGRAVFFNVAGTISCGKWRSNQ